MAVMDEFKEEREALKHGTVKQKLQYFWDYYKWYVIVAIILVIVVVYQIKYFSEKKDIVFHAALLNAGELYIPPDEGDHAIPFSKYLGINMDEEEVYYDSTMTIGGGNSEEYTSAQKLMVLISAQEIDVMVTEVYNILRYAYQNDFIDLRTILTEEQLEQYKDNIYYMDAAVARQIDENDYSLTSDSLPEYPNPFKPEAMEEPIPVGVRLPEGSQLLDEYQFGGQAVVSVMINTTRVDYSVKFIEYMMQTEESN